MAEVIDLLATLTVHRDRERLDVSLAQALMGLVRPQGVGVWRLVGEGDGEGSDQRWLMCARLQAGMAAPCSDPPWTDLSMLPTKESAPLRVACMGRQMQVAEPDPLGTGLIVTAFPVPGDREQPGVVEVVTSIALTPDELRAIHAVLRVFGNFQALLDYSQRDTLTGLLNRKTFDESFMKTARHSAGGAQAALFESRRPEQAARYWIGVLDIDHFKSVNDRYGHLIGDEVLLLVARIMRSTFRFQDRLFRFGGEEFVVMMRCADEADAMRAFERFRQNMAEYPFPQVGSVTGSIGFTEVQSTDTPSAAFERADRAVYHAKQNGRNMVCSHAELVRTGALKDDTKVGDVELF
ncbi:MAG: GGDEF domain-containing protein [Aquabacterium sp.]|jgi:diguanylate cyclase (GGDEF)-like protein|nr:MAG: GGDEF domain-containing protein [Aquabacterium sp.]